MFDGKYMKLEEAGDGLLGLTLERKDGGENVLSEAFLDELTQVMQELESVSAQGLIVSSAAKHFALGADVTEFPAMFRLGADEIEGWLSGVNALFARFAALPYASVSVIGGMALGGGFELALATDFRIGSEAASVGLPEVTLGICPGWGGTVRLPRLIGTEQALNWMLAGAPKKAAQALEAGALDQVVSADQAMAAARTLLQKLHADATQLQQRREDNRRAAAELPQTAPAADGNPAVPGLQNLLSHSAALDMAAALRAESALFARLAGCDATQNLVSVFLSGQAIKRKYRKLAAKGEDVGVAAVIGAGVMGGGIASLAASRGVRALMKDISDEALQLGMSTADQLLERRVSRGRMSAEKKQAILGNISPQLDYAGFASAGYVVEAVVENPKVKAAVLSECEAQLPETAVLASNTSTISIDSLAASLARPENFCGMHFFNPVHAMPLVEVIRGQATSRETINTTVALAMKLGKTPIVVGDCPGFLVNRVLFPYFNAFNRLLADGVAFERIDRVMEGFGWPMGPAMLADVIGLDVMAHADAVMVEGFPARMGHDATPVVDQLLAQGLRGQKGGRGFYCHDGGRGERRPSAEALALSTAAADDKGAVSDDEIVDRMMIPLCLETARCLDEGIVDTAGEADTALLYGLGFPRFRGGALHYIDSVGAAQFLARTQAFSGCGALYEVPDFFRRRAEQGLRYFDH
ncbi:3-hydroxyacyl-CoA dehydrogenase NAD-binding domain-containing protein [Granulosicoccaceae sp. 1_MG-2023]|nr:3-hydroxyacyl-CoA dehydrogenase NAD-binding domain-containing protein [Granulosicoccaceae sp. 1_MG-2023]